MSWFPVELRHDELLLRPLRRRDGRAWREARVRNRAWLERWEGAPPAAAPMSWEERHSRSSYAALLRSQRRLVRHGTAMPFAVVLGDRLVGQVTVSSIVRGAFDSATIGYWVDRDVAGRGVIPTAVALVVDHCFAVGLHRLEIDIRPENAPSLRVVEKLGFRHEGHHERYLFIDGDWRDHEAYALVREDLSGTLLSRYLASVRDTPRRLHQQEQRPH